MKKGIIIIAIAFLVMSCGSRQSHDSVKELVTFVELQKDSCRNYTENEWDRADSIYAELLKEADKNTKKLSVDDKKKVVKATTTYLFLQVYRDKRTLIENLKK